MTLNKVKLAVVLLGFLILSCTGKTPNESKIVEAEFNIDKSLLDTTSLFQSSDEVIRFNLPKGFTSFDIPSERFGVSDVRSYINSDSTIIFFHELELNLEDILNLEDSIKRSVVHTSETTFVKDHLKFKQIILQGSDIVNFKLYFEPLKTRKKRIYILEFFIKPIYLSSIIKSIESSIGTIQIN